MDNSENIIRKQKLFDYVLKITTETLDLIKSPDDPLLTSLGYFIYNNLGISVDVKQRKYRVLDDIQVLFEDRTTKITDNNLDKLENLLYGLDRNNDENIDNIKQFIFDNYNIQICESYLYPREDYHAIIDHMIDSI